MLKSTINQCQRKTSDPSDLKAMSFHQFSFNQVNNNLAGNKNEDEVSKNTACFEKETPTNICNGSSTASNGSNSQ